VESASGFHKGASRFLPAREAIDRATRKKGWSSLPPSLVELRRDKPLLAKIVMLRESGVSSTLRLLDSIIDASEYWIARRSLSSGGHSADPLAGDDGGECGAFLFI
jgi:hypothetical protein